MSEPTPENPTDRAIRVCGGPAKLAAKLGVTIQVVTNWSARRVPAEHCPNLERLTREAGDVVRCEALRPDIPWGVLREAPTGPGALDEAEAAR